MARALKIKYNASVVQGLQDITDAEIDGYAARLAARWMATTVSAGSTPVGSVNVNGATGTTIGSFVDTKRQNPVGTHPVGTTVTSTTYTFKQVELPDQTTLTGTVAVSAGGTTLTGTGTLFTTELAAGDIIRVRDSGNTTYDWALVRSIASNTSATLDSTANVKYTLSGATCHRAFRPSAVSYDSPTTYNSSLTGIQDMKVLELIDTVISRAASLLVVSGPSSYTLQSSAPVTGTWVSRATITDTNYNGTVATTYLWQRTDAGTGTVVRPMYRTGTSLKELSDAQLENWGQLLVAYLYASGKGRYAVANVAPTSPGTWVQVGSSFDDTRFTLVDTTYTGTFAAAFTGSYSRVFAGSYSTTFAGSYSRVFAGSYTRGYAGSYTGSYNTSYTRAYAGSYTGTYNTTYSRAFVASWARAYSRAFVRTYAGVNFSSYTGTYTAYFNGATYTGAFTRGYAGAYAGTYNTAYTRAYAGAYAGTYNTAYAGNYTGAFAGNYTGTFSGNYTGAFSGTYNNSFSRGFAGLTVTNTSETVSSIKLWIRTA